MITISISELVPALLVAMGVPTAITGFCFWLLERRIEKRDKKKFVPLIDEFEKFAENTPFLSLVKPFLHDNCVFLYDNPERLCAHYVDTWIDFSRPVTLKEELEFCRSFTDERLKTL